MKNTQQYDILPVYFCKQCLSLNLQDGEDGVVCEDCGGEESSKTTINCWEDMFIEKYGVRYIHITNKQFRNLAEFV